LTRAWLTGSFVKVPAPSLHETSARNFRLASKNLSRVKRRHGELHNVIAFSRSTTCTKRRRVVVHPYRKPGGYGMSITDKIALWTLIVTVIGVVLALAGIAVAIWTLKESAKVARAQFFVTIRALLANYDDIHAYLRPDGKWDTVPVSGPKGADEWARVELYMGTFEYCETLLRHGFLDEKEFGSAYSYRLENIVANPIIVEEKLINGLNDG
jgi:hypothetical protein